MSKTFIQSQGINFPPNPVIGDDFLADNEVTYIWTGDRWSAKQAISTEKTQFAIDGLYATSVYTTGTDIVLDGSTA
jgi:hypothetical protein